MYFAVSTKTRVVDARRSMKNQSAMLRGTVLKGPFREGM